MPESPTRARIVSPVRPAREAVDWQGPCCWQIPLARDRRVSAYDGACSLLGIAPDSEALARVLSLLAPRAAAPPPQPPVRSPFSRGSRPTDPPDASPFRVFAAHVGGSPQTTLVQGAGYWWWWWCRGRWWLWWWWSQMWRAKRYSLSSMCVCVCVLLDRCAHLCVHTQVRCGIA